MVERYALPRSLKMIHCLAHITKVEDRFKWCRRNVVDTVKVGHKTQMDCLLKNAHKFNRRIKALALAFAFAFAFQMDGNCLNISMSISRTRIMILLSTKSKLAWLACWYGFHS